MKYFFCTLFVGLAAVAEGIHTDAKFTHENSTILGGDVGEIAIAGA